MSSEQGPFRQAGKVKRQSLLFFEICLPPLLDRAQAQWQYRPESGEFSQTPEAWPVRTHTGAQSSNFELVGGRRHRKMRLLDAANLPCVWKAGGWVGVGELRATPTSPANDFAFWLVNITAGFYGGPGFGLYTRHVTTDAPNGLCNGHGANPDPTPTHPNLQSPGPTPNRLTRLHP